MAEAIRKAGVKCPSLQAISAISFCPFCLYCLRVGEKLSGDSPRLGLSFTLYPSPPTLDNFSLVRELGGQVPGNMAISHEVSASAIITVINCFRFPSQTAGQEGEVGVSQRSLLCLSRVGILKQKDPNMARFDFSLEMRVTSS